MLDNKINIIYNMALMRMQFTRIILRRYILSNSFDLFQINAHYVLNIGYSGHIFV